MSTGSTNELKGYGSNNLWGFSPSIDLYHPHNTKHVTNDTLSNTPYSILLLGASDARHIIHTISSKHKHSRPLHFFIMEPQASITARQILLMHIVLSDLDIGIKDRAELFLEIYGNILLRNKTYEFIQQQSNSMIELVTNGTSPLSSLFDFSMLKFRELDDLEFVFKFWRDEKKVFDASKLWNYRSQNYMNRQYDSRENIFDWDYQMKMMSRDKKTISIIHKQEYSRWRMHGVAFEIREAVHNKPNRTMATADIIKQDGLNVVKWGYFSDIITGPFVSFGLHTTETELLKTENDKHVKTSQDVSMHNIQEYIHLIKHQTPFLTAETKITEITEITEIPQKPLENVKITFLPCNPDFLFIKKKSKFNEYFDSIFLSNSFAHRIPDIESVLKPKGIVAIETIKFMYDLTREQSDLYNSKVSEMAISANLEKIETGINNEILEYKKK